ncbi:MAG: T9SS type A sorting domain-containing protein [Bacteroidetes bacterium]|nr:T9SS type A sorting domain-containing protein [Bacteroidota bacterium]
MKLSATLLIATLAFLLSGTVSAQPSWPTSITWVGYTFSNNTAVQDPQDVKTNKSEFDLVFETAAPYTVQVAASSTHVFFRLQVREMTTWTVGTYLLFISDNSGAVLGKVYLTLSGNAGEIHVVNASGSVDQMTGSGSHTSNIGGWARFSSVGGSSTHEYVDFQLPRTVFESVLGVTGQIQIKFYAGTSTGAGNVNNINTDWMTSSTSSVPTAADFGSLSPATVSGIVLGVLPVELTSFSAYLKANLVELRWNTATEKNNFGFEIERGTADGDWMSIGFVAGFGNSNSPKNYHFEDAVDGLSGTVSYRLKQIDRDGTIDYSSIVMVSVDAASGMSITDAYPNPFNPTTTVNFTLTESANVRLSLYDMTGREVKTVLENTLLDAGSHAQTINAEGLASGRYFLLLQTPSARSMYPLLLSK